MVSRQDLYIVQAHLTGDMRIDLMAFETFIDNFDDKVGIRQCFYYHPSSPNIFLLGQKNEGYQTQSLKSL